MRLLHSPLDQSLPNSAWRYGFAVAAVGLAFLLRLALHPVFEDRAPFLIFVLPVLVTACVAGIGPGLLAILLSLAAGTFAFVAPTASWAVTNAADLATIALFTANAGAIIWVADRLARVRQRAQRGTQAAAASEERFRLLVESVQDYAIYLLDPDGRIASWNAGAERLKGWRADEVLGQHVSIFYPREARDRGRPEEELRLARDNGVSREEAGRIRKDGSEFIAEVTLTALYDEQGRLRGYAKVTRDITDRKQAEATLRDSEALKSAILASALDCIVTITDKGRVVEWNPAAEQTFGHARTAVLDQSMAELIIPPEYRDKHYQGLARYLATGDGPVLGKRIEVEAVRADDSRFPVELAITPTHVTDKPHFTAHLRDISERKRAEAQLHESAQRLRATYEHAFVGIAEVDPQGRFLRVNEHFCSMTGYSRDELLGRSFSEVTHPDDREHDLQLFYQQMRGERGSYSHQKRYVHKSGEVIWIELQASTVNDENGMPLYGIRITRDITERKRAEEALRELTATLEHRVEERTRALEEVNEELKAFGYTVSHDLRAPLRAMEGFADILLDEFADKLGEDGQRYARRIVDAARRMDDLIQGLLAYSRVASSDLHLQRVELASLVEKVAAELGESPEHAAATIEVRMPLPAVHANPTVLGQIVCNLLSNAVKFVPKDRVPAVQVWSEARDNAVRLWVEDNGIGIAPEHQSQIFNVFQRLHGPAAYAGSGIGLAIVRKGAERMGGRSGVISEAGKGSRFWVELPKAEENR